MSIVEEKILSKTFVYKMPYFYNFPHALRCELCVGGKDVYMKNAKARARKIYDILFDGQPDAIIIDHCVCDPFSPDDAEWVLDGLREIMVAEAERLVDIIKLCAAHPTKTITLPLDDEDNPDIVRRNRIVCYKGKSAFDIDGIIDERIEDKEFAISFVSFENECIYSIYDDRGCDIVFFTHEKMKEYYERLQPYFLDYDVEEMKKRLAAE